MAPVATLTIGIDAQLTGPGTLVDGFDEVVGLMIASPSNPEILAPGGTIHLRALASRMSLRPELRGICGIEFVSDHLCRWLERARRQPSATEPWADELFVALSSAVAMHTMLVPLDGLAIDRPFRVADVTFSWFTPDDIERMSPRGKRVEGDRVHERNQRVREFQGRVYARYEHTSEPLYAQALAIDRVERALDVLRYLHPATRDVRVQCFFGRRREVPDGARRLFIAQEGGLYESNTLLQPSTWRTMIDGTLLTLALPFRERIDRILTTDDKSELEQLIVGAVRLIAHGAMSASAADRLAAAITSCESLLIRNDTEPIGVNLGLRMAFLIGSTPGERRELIAELKRGYALRSRFTHHGDAPEDVELVNRVLFRCWKTVWCALLATDDHKTRDELLDALQDRILA